MIIQQIAFLYVYLTASVDCQGSSLAIPLNRTITFENRELYSDFKNLGPSSALRISFSNINQSLSHVVLQAHAHLKNITLYQNMVLENNSIVGANVGMVVLNPLSDTYVILNSNKCNVRIYIAVHGYVAKDPIPGACSLDHNLSPIVRITSFKDYMFMNTADASNGADPSCTKAGQTFFSFYMMYLPELNFGQEEYFEGLRKMMTKETVLKFGIPQTIDSRALHRVLSSYPGAGRVFVVIAYPMPNSKLVNGIFVPSGYSIYVPSHSYGCDVIDDKCEDTDDLISTILCAVLLAIGLFVCFFGHHFFKTQMFLAGFFSCVIFTYVVISLTITEDKTTLLASSITFGLFFGAFWLLLWWLYGIPVMAVVLPSLNLGFLLASIFYYKLPANIMYLEIDLNFWSLFNLVMFLTALALVSVTFAANITSCAILGAYATVYSIDYFIGSNLKYIVVNIIRRAVVDGFNNAVILPPFQKRELLLTITWMVLAALGFTFQHWYNNGRPPFPPPPRNTRPTMPEPYMYSVVVDYSGWERTPATEENRAVRNNNSNERTPLLNNTNN